MKTVHSQVLSSDPISLSDATSFLSAFNTSVCGGGGRASVAASPETCWFVRRALASFQELEQLHHKLNDRSSDRKPRSETHNDDAKTTVGDNPSQSVATSRDVTSKPRSSHSHDDVISRRVKVEEQSEGGEIAEIDDDKKKKKKKKVIIGNIGENGGRIEEGDGESDMVKKEKKKKKKKKRDNVDENPGEIKEEEEDGESEMKSEEVKREEKKKKKKRKSEVLESGEVDASEEQQEKRKKKRKSEVLESCKVDASEEQQEKRKKRRKS